MSKKKYATVSGRTVMVWDNSLDVVLAHLVEAARERGSVSDACVENWAVVASVPDLAFVYPMSSDDPGLLEMSDLLREVRVRVADHGPVTQNDLESWSVHAAELVSDGHLRTTLSTEALLEVVDGLVQMVAATLPPGPPDGWFLGLPVNDDRLR